MITLLSQEIENEKLKLEHVQFLEENSGLRVQNQKLSEEASYAKELASAAAVELKNLAAEVTKLSLLNAKLEKELLAARELMSSRSSNMHSGSGGNRKNSDGTRPGRRGRVSGRVNEGSGAVHDDFDVYNLDPEDLKMELQARKQREAALEAAFAEKEVLEDQYRKRVEEGKKREAALENDLANMWVLVAQLKKEGGAIQELKNNISQNDCGEHLNDSNIDNYGCKDPILKDGLPAELTTPSPDNHQEEPLVARLKVNKIFVSRMTWLFVQILMFFFCNLSSFMYLLFLLSKKLLMMHMLKTAKIWVI